MACSSDEEGWAHPIGYCVGWKDLTDEEYAKFFPWANVAELHWLKTDYEKRRPFRDKYHNDGHTTREEAWACFLKYEFDQELRFYESTKEMRKCAVCGVWTPMQASLGEFKHFYLCETHKNREGVQAALDKDDLERR